MIEFDVNKLRSVYVFIVKITSSYVYVTSHRNGEIYQPKGTERHEFKALSKESRYTPASAADVRAVYKNLPAARSMEFPSNRCMVTKIPIDQTVYALYKTYARMTTFSRPRLASLNFYGETIVSIETQQWSKRLGGFQDANKWKSYFARSLVDLRGQTNNKESFIDGVDIFWFEEDASQYDLDKDGAFSMVSCKAVKLGNMGRPLSFKNADKLENKANASGDKSLLKEIDNFYHLRVRNGVVLRYRPEASADNGKNLDRDMITVYSSVLAEIRGFTSGAGKSKSREEREEKRLVRALYEMCHDTAPSQANLTFLLNAARTIGKLYGMQEAHFLNVPQVMQATGQMNLMDIPETQRGMIAIGISAQEALAWLFRFIYMEDKLNNMRKLIKCMKQCLTKGLMPLSQDSLVKEEYRGKEIPRLNVEEAKQQPLKNLGRLLPTPNNKNIAAA